MKKMNKKGFVLAETITISIVVITALVIIYTQFINVENSYYRAFNYNNVNNLYLVEEVKKFINTSGYDTIANYDYDENYFLELTDCSTTYIKEYIYCENLFNSIGAKRVIITKNNTGDLIKNINDYNFSDNLKRYIKNSKSLEEGTKIIVEFNDNTIASLKLTGQTYTSYATGQLVTLKTGSDTTSTWYVMEESDNKTPTVKLIKATYYLDEYEFDDGTRTTINNSYCLSNAGCNAYAANGTTVTEDSKVKKLIDSYSASLNLGENLIEARLVTLEELALAGCDMTEYVCNEAYDWVRTPSNYYYMTMTPTNEGNGTEYIYVVGNNFYIYGENSIQSGDVYAVRPVIIVSKNVVG